MRNTIIILLGSAMASIISMPHVSGCFARHTDSNNLREQQEIRQTFKLTPGTRVEVSRIKGSVDIETANMTPQKYILSVWRRADKCLSNTKSASSIARRA